MKMRVEVIAEAYGKFWDGARHYIHPKTGSMDVEHWISCKIDIPFERMGFSDRRPISLKGIENNNGWNLVSEGLPEETMYCEICINGNACHRIYHFKAKTGHFYWGSNGFMTSTVSHWKQVKLSDKPLF